MAAAVRAARWDSSGMSNRREAADRLLTNPAYSLGLTRRALSGLSWNGAAMLLLAGVVAYRELKPREVRYFATTPDFDPVPMTPLDRPIVDNRALLAWATEAVAKAYSLDFVRYRQQAEEAKANFEGHAWETWSRSFMDAKNLAKIVDAKMVSRIVPLSAPTVVQEGVVRGRYAWKLHMPMVLTFENTNGATPPDNRLMEVLVARTDEARFARRIAIAQLVDRPYLERREPKVAAR